MSGAIPYDRPMLRKVALIALMIWMHAGWAGAASTGALKLEVLGTMGVGAKPNADVVGADGKKVGEVAPGGTIQLAPGTYSIVLPAVGGTIRRDGLKIEPDRTHTVLITNVAVLGVSVKDSSGKDPGFGVTVTETEPPHRKMAEFLSGDLRLFAPSQVDVKVDAPPQGYYWHAVTLIPGRRADLVLSEVRPAQLRVKTSLGGSSIDGQSRVIIYRAGTQKQVAVSETGPEHLIKLDPGDYDIYVENHTGKGRPYAVVSGLHLESDQKAERAVALDEEASKQHGN